MHELITLWLSKMARMGNTIGAAACSGVEDDNLFPRQLKHRPRRQVFRA